MRYARTILLTMALLGLGLAPAASALLEIDGPRRGTTHTLTAPYDWANAPDFGCGANLADASNGYIAAAVGFGSTCSTYANVGKYFTPKETTTHELYFDLFLDYKYLCGEGATVKVLGFVNSELKPVYEETFVLDCKEDKGDYHLSTTPFTYPLTAGTTYGVTMQVHASSTDTSNAAIRGWAKHIYITELFE